MVIVPNLHFDGDCEKAIELYERAFKTKRTILLKNKDADPRDIDEAVNDEDLERVYHAEMLINNQRLMLNDNANELLRGTNVSLMVSFDSVEEVKAAYDVLREGARIIVPFKETTYSHGFVSLIDRYGVRWELMKEV